MSFVRITHLRCEYLVAPLGLDERTPRLSWQLESAARGVRQTAYRIRVASTAEKLAAGTADLWDSGRVESNATTHIAYAGTPLASRQHCHWHVEVWIADPQVSDLRSQVSAPSRWTMGLLEKSDWSAKWIAADPEIIRRDPQAIAPTLTDPGTPALFRREFEVPGPVVRATVYATARGLFELRANGRRIGEDLFAPEWTDYDKRLHYRTYDVTGLIARGPNCLAATLGDGWWSGYVGWQEKRGRYGSLENSLLIQLEIELADGARFTLATDGSWTCNTGPILASDLQMGETYDARREHAGWDLPKETPRVVLNDAPPGWAGVEIQGFAKPADYARLANSDAWLPAREVPPPSAVLVAQRAEPVRIIETLEPDHIGNPPKGTYLYDCGQNISGWVRLHLEHVPAGTKITLRHGERLTSEGSLYTANLRRAKATDTYVVAGRPKEVWQPHFTFHGFQYFEITIDGPRPPHAFIRAIACVIHSATPPAGHFECSNAHVNRLWLNGLWSQRDNFLSVPTDCPQRDERLGWMGDAQVFCRTAMCNMDVAAFFTKWMTDVEDAQTAEGIFPDVAPRLREDIHYVGLGNLGGGAAWADAGIIIPYTLWRVYGDLRLVERHWGAMVRWLDWIERHNPDGLRLNQLFNNYGDWLCIPSDTSFGTHSPMKNLLATAYWADDAAKMARLARALGRESEAARFQAMFERVRAAFQKEWLKPDGRLAVETQTAYLLALAFDLLPPNLRAAATEHLVANIRNLDWHLSTGFVGISHLNPQLTLAGHADVAYRLLLQETYPSWLFPVLQGATTIWERWDSWTIAGGFHKDGMNSFNHYSLGSVGEWLFRHVAGIELDPEVPGYQRFVLQPHLGAGLDFARATYRTMHGEIASAWRREGDKLTWTVTVPPNTTAQVFIPSEPGTDVHADGLTVTGREGRFARCEAPAGTYTFTSTYKVEGPAPAGPV
ncbi:alpha-L-rhamnosidase [Oleiharenicola lentus]|uniref:alpha-L-rhamnosidase n=1 Tax=Oleiharenicola lentus TaxID=2508720 RepID=A0A4Q1C598_9BACT|nr:glycoside hydrolase family 78 protein [Oleiharenicola lentus]RXK53608.1 alpha-L-rhamnosidase [Oleiharenicola lentus]